MEQTLDKAFWDEHWKNDNAPWDMGFVSPPLKEYIDQLTDKTVRILIPGCGNAHEAGYLLQQGFANVTVVDISPALIQSLEKKFESNAGKELKIVCGNFFDLQGEFDLVLEQTLFCALDPSLRSAYANKVHELLAENGKLVGLLFNTQFEKQGPPFGGSKEEYEALFAPLFKFKTVEECYNSHPRRAGTELFVNFVKISNVN